ncbi:MAG: hypothetical protein ABIV21_01055 [Pyrinomonadaceae bacterium]
MGISGNYRVLKLRTAALAALLAISTACGDASSSGRKGAPPSGTATTEYLSPEITGKIETPEVEESSGLAASLCQPDVLWTHNDAGDGPYLYAISTEGKHLGTWKVRDADNDDWEDIDEFKDAAGKCYIFIGDIGNNKEDRNELTIYSVAEPVISAGGASSNSKQPLETVPAESFKFKYPDKPNNAETMMVHPTTRDIYVLTKREKGASGIYKLKPAFGSTVVAEKVGELSVPSFPVGLLTGGAISPNGRRVVLCDYQSGYELVLPDGESNFDSIWRQQLTVVNLGKRRQGEAITYGADGNAIYATSENKNPPLTKVSRR